MHSTSQLAQECLGLSEAVIDVGFGAGELEGVGAEEFTPLECEHGTLPAITHRTTMSMRANQLEASQGMTC
jgi:hypothetical protein